MPRWVLIIYTVLGGALWMIPLFDILHAPSSALVATVAFFVAGSAAIGQFEAGASWGRVAGVQAGALLIPWAMLTVSLLWSPHCEYGRGVLFYLLFPGVTLLFSIALAYALTGLSLPRPRALLTGLGVAILILGPLVDLGRHPQMYTYNPIFGGILGPLYDEELALRPGLVAARGVTLLWAAAFGLVGAGARLRARTGTLLYSSTGRWMTGAGVAVAVGLAGAYATAPTLGLNTPAEQIQRSLGGHQATTHFDIYYDPDALSEDEVDELAEKHEYRYAWLRERTNLEVDERIASYIYPDPDTKGALTGSRRTSLAPVWLSTPQIHMLYENVRRSFAHELAHVFSREVGLPLIHASWAVGLVEGWAVALEPPDGRPTPHEQVAVSTLHEAGDVERALSEEIAHRLTPWGFWTGRGAVSYTMFGSFTQFLLEAYGIDRLKQVYAWANFEDVYGRPVQALADDWQQQLDIPYVDRAAEAEVTRRFARPSIFEVACPFYVPPYRQALRAGRDALDAQQPAEAAARFTEALEERPTSTAAHDGLARARLAQGEASAVVQQIDTLDTERRTAALFVRLGDAQALLEEPLAARQAYREARLQLPAHNHERRARVLLRTATADRPDVVSILTSLAPPAEQADQLADETPTGGSTAAWKALQQMEARKWDGALATWASVDAKTAHDWGLPAHANALQRAQLRWTAHAGLRAGQYDTAEAAAAKSAKAFRRVGAFNAAAQVDDLKERIRWRASAGSYKAASRLPPRIYP